MSRNIDAAGPLTKSFWEPVSEEFVFAGQKPGKPLSVMALEMVLRRMKITDATVHGFRSALSVGARGRKDEAVNAQPIPSL